MRSTPKAVEEITGRLTELGYPKCAERIEFLRRCDDFEKGEEPLSPASAQSFLSFIQDADFRHGFRGLKEPFLGLSSEGVLGASWKIAGDKHLYIQFHSAPDISFAMTGPAPALSRDGRFHLNGRGACAEVIKTLRAHGVTEWRAA